MSTVPLLLRIVASSVSVSKRAGSVICNVLKSGELNIVEKACATDLQTEADKAAQRCIISSLAKKFSKITIIGEEDLDGEDANSVSPDLIETASDVDVLEYASKMPDSLNSIAPEDVVVWVDPLDGTHEFTKGFLDHVTVLIGIAVKGKAVAGVIYQPFFNYKQDPTWSSGRCIWGIVGLGSFGYTSDSSLLHNQDNLIVTTRSHSNQLVNDAVEACKPSHVERVGGAGNKVLLVLEGRAHAYVFASPGCKKWDICAPEAVLMAAGGNLTDLHGKHYNYDSKVEHSNKGGVLATFKSSKHQEYVDCIPKHVKDELSY